MFFRRLPILMYHKVDELPPGSSDTNYVRPAQFAEQVAALRQWGFEPITFARWLSRDALPPRPIILTFDDGYRDFERNAWPVLEANGVPATVFLVSSRIGGTNAWDADKPQETLLGRESILALQAAG